MGPANTYFLSFLVTCLGLIQMSGTSPVSPNVPDVCSVLQEIFKQVPDCTKLPPEVLRLLAENLKKVGYDPSNPRNQLKKLSTADRHTTQDQLPDQGDLSRQQGTSSVGKGKRQAETPSAVTGRQRNSLLNQQPRNILRNLSRSEFGINNLISSLFYDSAILKMFEIKMARYFS